MRDLDALVHWAVTLQVPQALLWFDLPATLVGSTSHPPGEVANDRDDPEVVVSQHEWRLTRRYLNVHRADLARPAANLYEPELRLTGTALLTCPEWMPGKPVPIENIQLRWREHPSPLLITGAESVADPLLPLRLPGRRFDRYTAAIRYVDPPRLFENRPSYRLLDIEWGLDAGRMEFGLATYFDKLDVAEAVGHEFAKAFGDIVMAGETDRRSYWQHLPFRRSIGDLFDLESRAVVPAVTTLTLLRNTTHGTASFILHWRDPALVATAGGQYDVIPAGEFQPSSVAPRSYTEDLDLWRNIVREYSEELCGTPEHDGSRGVPVDYASWPFFRAMARARDRGRVRAFCLAVGLDALTLAATIPTVVVVDEDTFAEIFGEVVHTNAEGVTVMAVADQDDNYGIPFTEEHVRRFLTEEPMAPPGAACLSLAWKHRDMLLGSW